MIALGRLVRRRYDRPVRLLLPLCVLVALLCMTRPAHAGRGIVIINTGDDVAHIRDLPADVAKETGYPAIGYHYSRFGVFWLDLWRWGGEFCAYRDNSYAPLSDADLAGLGGATMPWKYRAPPGLMIILALVALGMAPAGRRRPWILLGLGGIWLAVAFVLYQHGVDIAFAIPGLLGVHHVVAAVLGLRAGPEPPEAAAPDGPPPPEPSSEPL